ncbi:hypothetical protein [Streptomyces sp. NRRL S-813]|uniref:hypothetical protein n=1 Tax=Streptomyces sp. NRRL S-813 TaxID=1463919 RepID=UPI001F46CEF5|nr:hypothetical protein [Streptomyces sp. NRRL S-813]
MPEPGSKKYDVKRARMRKEAEQSGISDQDADKAANEELQQDPKLRQRPAHGARPGPEERTPREDRPVREDGLSPRSAPQRRVPRRRVFGPHRGGAPSRPGADRPLLTPSALLQPV